MEEQKSQSGETVDVSDPRGFLHFPPIYSQSEAQRHKSSTIIISIESPR